MHKVRYEATLVRALEAMVPRWGPVLWRPLLEDFRPSPDPHMAAMFSALADVEEVSFYMQVLIRRVGLTRLAPVREFNALWLAEESEHARAMTEVAQRYGAKEHPRMRHTRSYRLLHSLSPSTWIAATGLLPQVTLALYLAMGTLQEYVALSTYRILADMIGDPPVAEILRRIAQQEGRHMRFYRTGAIAVLEDDPVARRAVRHVVHTSWRPPGVDLFGLEGWVHTFRPLLSFPGAQARYLRMDDLAADLPGLQGVRAAERFLDDCRQIAPELPPRQFTTFTRPELSRRSDA